VRPDERSVFLLSPNLSDFAFYCHRDALIPVWLPLAKVVARLCRTAAHTKHACTALPRGLRLVERECANPVNAVCTLKS
jgi:hypothetical protein